MIPPHATEIIEFFETRYGSVESLSYNQIVFDTMQIAVCVASKGNVRTLFTVGMSNESLKVPQGFDEFQYVELFIQLPQTHEIEIAPGSCGSWPVDWLINVAKFPHRQNTWLGAPAVILAKNGPDDIFSDTCRFSGMLLVIDCQCLAGYRSVNLYRMCPLYWDEIELEREIGTPAFMQKLDERKVSFIVDCNRPSIAAR
ncbi:suppressor of fused domain protein [Stieleria varia]|uniref:Suppressor of fused protein (SUFU) n=1 Tax=Stieleria varia TaxID=2528005 RepID=A0A5C5ZW73_9BACT|nr:suppressor of fused domain protein [Stieleria varia]TWT91288.1 Suppressor of fused protein (SUFU) [Stieleria varia]